MFGVWEERCGKAGVDDSVAAGISGMLYCITLYCTVLFMMHLWIVGCYSIQLHKPSQLVTSISLASHGLTWLTNKRVESAKLSLMQAEPSQH